MFPLESECCHVSKSCQAPKHQIVRAGRHIPLFRYFFFFLLVIWSEIATSESTMRLEIKLCRPKFIIGRQQVTCPFSKKISHCQRKESKENLFRSGGTTRLRGFCSPEHRQPCLLHHSVGIAATSCYVSYSSWICWLTALSQSLEIALPYLLSDILISLISG